jgi:DNA-directed RNA polymerase subunit RPC12/RpoP
MIRFACPSCSKAFHTAEPHAGRKFFCPDCGQRVQVPARPAKNQTVLAKPRTLPRYAANDGTYAGDLPYPSYLPKRTRLQRLWGWIWQPTRIDPPENSGETLIRFVLNLLRLGLVIFVVKWALIIAFLIVCGLGMAVVGILSGGYGVGPTRRR